MARVWLRDDQSAFYRTSIKLNLSKTERASNPFIFMNPAGHCTLSIPASISRIPCQPDVFPGPGRSPATSGREFPGHHGKNRFPQDVLGIPGDVAWEKFPPESLPPLKLLGEIETWTAWALGFPIPRPWAAVARRKNPEARSRSKHHFRPSKAFSMPSKAFEG